MKLDQKFENPHGTKLALLERETRKMKKTNAKKEYLKMRISMLKIERDNPNNDDYDSQWYNRLIQELEWAESILLSDNYPKTSNCFMENELNG
tara:strand:- start:38127 stop:38405 length:279 start_codon:yes stop_codon:yes gene_type:complete